MYEISIKKISQEYKNSKLKCYESKKTPQIMPNLLEKKRKITYLSQKEKRKA